MKNNINTNLCLCFIDKISNVMEPHNKLKYSQSVVCYYPKTTRGFFVGIRHTLTFFSIPSSIKVLNERTVFIAGH